jgi:hypothetical protein
MAYFLQPKLSNIANHEETVVVSGGYVLKKLGYRERSDKLALALD